MAVACRDADHDIAWLDQGQMGCNRRAGQPIEYGYVVGFWGTAQMLKGQCPEPLEAQRLRDLVIGKCDLFGGERQRVLEPGKHVDVILAALPDQRLCALQFLEIVFCAANDVAASVRELRRIQVAKAIDAHLRCPSAKIIGRRVQLSSLWSSTLHFLLHSGL